MGDKAGAIFVAICLFFFAFSTILSWNLFGKLNVDYLFGKKATVAYTILAIGFIFLGSILSNDLVWELTDMFNYLMVLPNAIALIALSKTVKECATGKDVLPLAKENVLQNVSLEEVTATCEEQECVEEDTCKEATQIEAND